MDKVYVISEMGVDSTWIHGVTVTFEDAIDFARSLGSGKPKLIWDEVRKYSNGHWGLHGESKSGNVSRAFDIEEFTINHPRGA